MDYETLEKLQKALALIDESFGGNESMKRAVLDNYGVNLDISPTTFVPKAIDKTSKSDIDKDRALQDKLVYGDKWFVIQNR